MQWSAPTVDQERPTPTITTFDRLRAVIAAGLLRRMSELQVKVYMVMLLNSDYVTGDVRISAERLAREAGTANVNRARGSLQALETLGAIATIEEGGGRGGLALRRLLCPQPLAETPLFAGVELPPTPPPSPPERGTPGVPDSVQETGTQSVPVLEGNRDAARLETGTLRDGNRDAARSETGTLRVPRSPIPPLSPHTPSPPPAPTPPIPTTPPAPHAHPGKTNGAPKAQGSGPGTTEAGKEKFMVERGVYPKQARRFAQAFHLGAIMDHWREITNNPRVRDKGAAFAARLRENLPEPVEAR